MDAYTGFPMTKIKIVLSGDETYFPQIERLFVRANLNRADFEYSDLELGVEGIIMPDSEDGNERYGLLVHPVKEQVASFDIKDTRYARSTTLDGISILTPQVEGLEPILLSQKHLENAYVLNMNKA